MTSALERKRLGAWYTPSDLVELVVDAVVTDDFIAGRRRRVERPMCVVDPACGDGRFLRAVADRLSTRGLDALLVGVDVDPAAVEVARGNLAGAATRSDVVCADALTCDWVDIVPDTVDLVIGNPPFLSQMAAATTRGGASRRGGGPYADAAAEFLELAADLVDPAGGRVAFVLPQSLLSARDAGAVRTRYDQQADLVWSWWTGERVFEAQVHTCVVAFEFGRPTTGPTPGTWSHVVTARSGVPVVGEDIRSNAGTLGDRGRLNANFRDEYYGMVPAVADHDSGPMLVTSGLIDPGVNLWGQRPVRFAKQRFERPRLDLSTLDERMTRWAAQRLVPKVLVANQTRIIEAVADPTGDTLPGVPVVAVYPIGTFAGPQDVERRVWEIAAVLTSPVASAWVWQRSAGTGLSADAVRVGPVILAGLPWPAGSLDDAVTSLRAGDVRACAAATLTAYGVSEDSAVALMAWWSDALDTIEQRRPETS